MPKPEIRHASIVETRDTHSAEILPTHSAGLCEAALKRAAELLRAGEVVALPTETVYGLAANALDAPAVERIYAIKGRPASNPIIVHVASLEMARACVATWPDAARQLAAAFWPGPLTLVLPKSKAIPEIVTAGGSTVGVRWPSHPFIQAIIRRCGFPLAAPSANPSNGISPTTADHVFRSLGHQLKLIIDGGQCQVGIESTVLDASVAPPRLLRPGMIHELALLAVIGELGIGPATHPGVLRSPGLLAKHYAPKAKLTVWSWSDDATLESLGSRSGVPLAGIHVIAHTRIPSGGRFGRVAIIPHDAEAFGRALYSELHQCDDAGAELIVVEALPDLPEWQAIADRLRRAAAQVGT